VFTAIVPFGGKNTLEKVGANGNQPMLRANRLPNIKEGFALKSQKSIKREYSPAINNAGTSRAFGEM
jgi:hypothetical protein